MTECERFIKEGLFTPDFFKEEVRCDFLVTTERKKIWAVLLDLLRQFDEVCRKHGLRYYLMYGSLLGAVRHKGFIPWDDDLDVAMPREDYEKLLQLESEFCSPYFLQVPGRDNGYYYSFVKVRNSRTTGLSEMFAYERFNQGLFLDVFPLDSAKEETALENALKIERLNIENSTAMRRSNPELTGENLARVRNYSGRDPVETLREIDSIARQQEGEDTGYVATATLTLYKPPKNFFHREDFNRTVMMPFEGFDFPVPIGWERILKGLYGDYMKFPPSEQRGVWHGGSVFDPDRPYVEYLKEMTK